MIQKKIMRLSEFEIDIIKKTALDIFGKDTAVFIFGSRTDDSAKGGDVDIYIKCPNCSDTLKKKIKYSIELEKTLGLQKFDVIINDNQYFKTIYKIAEDTGIRL
jgi:predicted nucleotidyltransferase